MTERAVVRKGGPFIEISADGTRPLEPAVLTMLEKPLYYNHMTFQFGAAAYDPLTGAKQAVKKERRRLFQYDEAGRLICQKGFYPRMRGLLEDAGFEVAYIDKDPPKAAKIYEADWDRVLSRFEFRPRQLDCLSQIDMHDYGLIDAPPAFGKTHVMAMIATMYPKAKIAITTKRKDVVAKINTLLTKWIPSVGQVGGGKKKKGRVTVYTADSLHHADYDEDILLADECHELMTDRLAETLSRFWYSRNFAFSATPDMRMDNAHYRMEGLFGPRIFHMTQQEAEQHSLVTPVLVQWIDVNTVNPAKPFKTTVGRKRHGIWRNPWRNQVIAETARALLEDQQQVLVLVDTVDHALHLRKLLPEAKLCYSEGAMDEEKRRFFIRNELLAEDEIMTLQLRTERRQQFERREIMCAIATGVWSVGVSFDSLNVLIRADAGASETSNIQMPGRVCRIDPKSGKACGILIDFYDLWDTGFLARSTERRRDYHQRGWTQYKHNGEIWTPRGNRVQV